jgi:hypothetical protein
MGKMLRSNDDSPPEESIERTSAFARLVLTKVGGSCVYISKKEKKDSFIDVDPV